MGFEITSLTNKYQFCKIKKKKNKYFKQSYHNGYKRLLKLLVEHLSADINTRQPATITGVTVIPADGVLQPANLQGELIQ